MDKSFAENKMWLNLLVGADILLSLFMAAEICLTLASGGYKGSWHYLAVGILACLLKVFGLFRIWKNAKSGIAILAAGVLLLVVIHWPLSWGNMAVKLLPIDLVILIWALWSFKKTNGAFGF